MSREDRAAAVVRATAGSALCDLAAVTDEDPSLALASSLRRYVAAAGGLKQALDLALPYERLYWLTFNVSILTSRAARQLLSRGFAADALPLLVHAVLAVENGVNLCLPRFLPWRVELYRLACAAYVAVGAVPQARVRLLRYRCWEVNGTHSVSGIMCYTHCRPTICLPRSRRCPRAWRG